MNARYYEPSTGRFISQDSYSGNAYEPWTQHLYSYCGNNPTNMTDPTGHIAIEGCYRIGREEPGPVIAPEPEPGPPDFIRDTGRQGYPEFVVYPSDKMEGDDFETEETIAELKYWTRVSPVSLYDLTSFIEGGNYDTLMWLDIYNVSLQSKLGDYVSTANDSLDSILGLIDAGITIIGFYATAGSNPTTGSLSNEVIQDMYMPGAQDVGQGLGGWFTRGLTGKTKNGIQIKNITRASLKVIVYGHNKYMGTTYQVGSWDIKFEYDNVSNEWLYASVDDQVYYDNYGRKIGR